MVDVQHSWAGDLTVSATGDLATVSGGPLGTERVLRRLLTNQSDYLWQPGYGAGLARFVGQPVDGASVAAVIRLQMRREAGVASSPEPVIAVTTERPGTLAVDIRYADAVTAQAQSLSFQIPG